MQRINFTCNALRLSHFLKALSSAFSSSGRQKLIEEFASYFNVENQKLFLFGAGRMALYSFLKSLKLKADDEVLIIGYTCVVVPLAAKFAGAKVRYTDISEQTLNLDTEKLIQNISENTKALIVSHNFGILYKDIASIKSSFPELVIIEDAAHALGSRDDNGKLAGTLGDASFFSFEFSKPISSGMGGLLIINNNKYLKSVQLEHEQLKQRSLLNRFRILKSLAIQFITANKLLLPLRGLFVRILKFFSLSYTSSVTELSGTMPQEYPVAISNFQAMLLYRQMKDLKDIQRIKMEVAETYHRTFGDMHVLSDFYFEDNIYLRYPLLFKHSISLERVDVVKKKLQKSGYALGNWFDDVIYPAGSARVGYQAGECHVAESVAQRIVNLPIGIHSVLSEGDLSSIRKILDSV